MDLRNAVNYVKIVRKKRSSPANETSMRKSIVLALIFAVFLTTCAPTGWNGVSTPLEITARVGAVIAETVEPPGTENPFPMPEPPTVIPTLPSSRLSPTELWASPRHPLRMDE